MKKILAFAITLALLTGGEAVASDTFRNVGSEEAIQLSNISGIEGDFVSNDKQEIEEIEIERGHGYLCVRNEERMCYAYNSSFEREELINDIRESEQE